MRLRTCLAIALAATAVHAAPRLDFAAFLPDLPTQYRFVDGAPGIQDFSTRDYKPTGNIKVFIRNTGDQPLAATDITVDGTPIEQLREQREMLWWRCLPNPIPARGEAEVLIRPRLPVTKPVKVSVAFAGSPAVTADISPTPDPVRLVCIGFNRTMDEVFLVAARLENKPHTAARVFIDGEEVTDRTRLLSPTFECGVCPAVVRLKTPLKYGSYHVFKMAGRSGGASACVQRVYDGFVPAGSYGYGTVEDYARNGLNGYNNFRVSSKEELDFQRMLGMRGVFITEANGPPAYAAGHEGLFAYCLQDEPDCEDYSAQGWPLSERIGYMAPEMERLAAMCRRADPRNLIFLTIDQTYKPANYYVYGQLADVTNHDCYPVSSGEGARHVIEAVETAWLGIAPHPMFFTYQGVYEKMADPEKEAKRDFPRAEFPQEVRLMMLYAIGCGSRGLYNYMHASDATNEGSDQHPDVWNEIGIASREVSLIAPLIAESCPMPRGAGVSPANGTSAGETPAPHAEGGERKLWLRGLVAGPDSAILVAANDGYQETRDNFLSKPIENINLHLVKLSWLPVKAAWVVRDGAFEPLKYQLGPDGTTIQLPKLDIAEMILVSSDPNLPTRLLAEYQAREQLVANGLLKVARARLADLAGVRYLMRKIPADNKTYMILATGGGYGITHANLWNPLGEKYNALETGGTTQTGRIGIDWKFTIPPDRAGKRHTIYTAFGAYGPPVTFAVTGPDGKVLLQKEESGDWGGAVRTYRVVFPTAGEYTMSYSRVHDGKGEFGIHAARAAFVVPDE